MAEKSKDDEKKENIESKKTRTKKYNKKQNKKKFLTVDRILWIVAIFIFAIIAYTGKDYDWNTVLNTTNVEFNNTEISNNEGNLQVYFIDVGQADSILVVDKDKTMLIDAGTNSQGKNVVNFLKNKNISKIDYLIGTHPHEDHIGGLDDVINSFDIGNIYMPKVQTNTKTFEDVLDAVSNKGLKVTSPEVDDIFDLNVAKCQIMSIGTNEKNLNESSIVIRMTYGKQSFLFMGDAERVNEEKRTWPETTVLKVGHHGADTSTTKEFLSQVKPKIAVISVGKDNSYGHPKEITLEKLLNIDAKIYRTDTLGTILITSDGNINKVETNLN